MEHNELEILSLGEIWDMEFTPRDFIIDPLFRQGESMMLFGGPGVGKSMFILALSMLVAGGGKFLNWETKTPRKVLLIDGEMPIDDVMTRSKGLVWGIDGIDLQMTRENLRVMSRQRQQPDCLFPDISTEAGREQILEYAQGYDLVVLDNLSTLALDLGDENAASEFNDVVRILMTLKQAGVATILVHHSNKRGADYRGSSKLATTFEIILGMKPMDHPPIDWPGTKFTLEWQKYRGQKDASLTNSDMRFNQNEAGQIYWEARLSALEVAAQLVELVKTGEYNLQTELAAKMEVSKGQISKLKHRAIENGLISKDEWIECMSSGDF